ncbi:MAG: Nif11-like leader peptide family natural product precursor [Bacteroidales bacterium]|nr:Nif11-like leader peptide family natural product precursor [Bacteroidales bacterium]
MSKQNVEEFLSKGFKDRQFRIKYDNTFQIDVFVKLANEDGFDFTVQELKEVISGNGDIFESNGNPPKKGIWC